MAKDVGTAIHKSIVTVVLFLPCLVAFLGFYPYMVRHFVTCRGTDANIPNLYTHSV